MTVSVVAATVARGGTQPVYDISLSNRFRYESDATGTDADFRPYASVYGHDLVDGHLDGRFSGALDLDTNGDDATDRAFNESWPRVHEAALDLHSYGALDHLVLGRQYLPRVDYLHFDGLSLSLCEKDRVGFFAFGGRPVSYYTPYTSNAGEWLAGGGVRVRPLPSTEIQADAYGINDGGKDLLANAIRLSQSLGYGFSDSAEARWVDGGFSDLTARLYYMDPARYDVSTQVYWQAPQWGDDPRTRESRYSTR